MVYFNYYQIILKKKLSAKRETVGVFLPDA
jgi:hypothetical protein